MSGQGRTQTLNYYRVGPPPGKVVLVDAPGYGARGRSEWGELFDHYVDTRQEYVTFNHSLLPIVDFFIFIHRLKRIYILFSAKHGLNEIDKLMLASLSDRISAHGGTKHTLQAVITKLDTLPLPGAQQHIAKLKKEIFQAAPVCLPPIFTSVAKHPFLGVEELRANIMDACGLVA
jgi:GTP-binding protein